MDSGTWLAANGVLECSVAGFLAWDNKDQDDSQVFFSYACVDDSGASNRLRVHFRDNSTNPFDNLGLWIIPGQMDIVQKYNGSQSVLDTDLSADSVEGTWYDVWVKADGSSVAVYRREMGSNDSWDHVLSTSSASVTTSDQFRVVINGADLYQVDDFALLTEDGDTLETVAFSVNNANELTSMNDNGTTVNFTYDDWGRQTSKYTGSYSADYEYRYSHKLASVTSDFPGEGTVNYNYGGDGKRRARTAGADETWYNWDAGYTVVSEENDDAGAGTLNRTYVGRNEGYIDGSNPSTGSASYVSADHLGTTRELRDSSKSLTGAYAFTPYGEPFSHVGTTAPHTYTGHEWDAATGLYFAPYRFYNPDAARWMMRDPLGMIDGPNVYSYVMGNPLARTDLLGLLHSENCVEKFLDMALSCIVGAGGAGLAFCASLVACAGACTAATGGLGIIACIYGCLATGIFLAGIFIWELKTCLQDAFDYVQHCLKPSACRIQLTQ